MTDSVSDLISLSLHRPAKVFVDHLKHFVVDECDHIMESVKMRADLQSIFMACPIDKQVMMFTATLPANVKAVCLKFMKDVRLREKADA